MGPDDAFSRNCSPEELIKLEEKLGVTERELSSVPDDPRLLLEKAFILIRLGRAHEAFATTELLKSIEPGDPMGYLVAAIACFELGKPQDSLFYIHDAIEIAPEDGFVHLLRAILLEDISSECGQEPILESAENAIRFTTEQGALALAYYYKVNALINLERFTDVLATVSDAETKLENDIELMNGLKIRQFLDSTRLHSLLGLAEETFEKGQIERHKEYVEEAYNLGQLCIREHPESIDCFVEYSSLLVRLDQLDEALEVLDQGIANNPSNPGMYLLKSVLLNAKGESSATIETLWQVANLEGINDEVVMHCKGLAEDAGQGQEGLRIVQEYVTKKQRGEETSPLLHILPELIDSYCKQRDQLVNVIDYSEIEKLAEMWGPYQGRTIAPEKIAQWLKQFGEEENQKFVFKVLNGLRFYSEADERCIYRDLHKRVENIMRAKSQDVQLVANKRILLSSFYSSAGSETKCMRMYRQEVGISKHSCIDLGQLAQIIEKNRKVTAVVLVDNMIGTGDTACLSLENLETIAGEIIRAKKLLVLLIYLYANEEGDKRVREKLHNYFPKAELLTYTTVTEKERLFGDDSKVFTNEDERVLAKKLCVQYGRKLWEQYPLGYGHFANTVVFSDNCPNNSLPVLWETGKGWKPLFTRK